MSLNNNRVNKGLYNNNMRINGWLVDTKDKTWYSEASVLNTLRNTIMKKGKKSVANKIVNNILMLLRSSGVSRPLTLVSRSIKALMPYIETRPLKRGGQIMQVPAIVTKPRKFMLAVHWLVEAAKQRGKKHSTGRHGMSYGIAQELRAICLDSMLPTKSMVYSEAMSKRNKLHKNANSHRVNIHLSKKL
jgi:ribosomal protein S7